MWTSYIPCVQHGQTVSLNQEHVSDPILLWEAGKAFLRGKFIAYTSSFKKVTFQKYGQASEALLQAQCNLASSDSPEHKIACHEANCSFDLWADQQEQLKQSFLDVQHHKFGNKPGKLLSWLTNCPYKPTHIMALKETAQANLRTRNFYNSRSPLYGSIFQRSGRQRHSPLILDSLVLPNVTESQQNYLNAPLSPEEIAHTIKTLANSKAPGPDGYSAKFYKAISEDILANLQSLYNAVWDEDRYMPTGS